MPLIPSSSSLNPYIGVPSVVVQVQNPPVPATTVPTGVIGVIGTATGGEVNSPVRGSASEIFALFGNPQNATFDLATQVYLANIQGANDFVAVRVTDGTDVAASVNLLDTAGTPATGATLTSRFTGTMANSLKATIGLGSATTSSVITYKLTIFYTGQVPEVFDNIGGTGATFWANLVSAVNNGQSGVRPPSNYVIATVGSGTATPALTTYTLSGGTNGNSSVTSTTIVGTDGLTRTGIYCLRETAASIAIPADLTDNTKWATVQAFADSTYRFFAVSGAIGQQDSISTASTNLQNAGINSPAMVVNLGDWGYFSDTYNNIVRLGNPSAFRMGLLATLPPNNSVVNKPIRGIIDTQKSRESRKYSLDELDALRNARIDVIGEPVFDSLGLQEANGKKFLSLLGINTSSDPLANHDNYIRMNFFLGHSTEFLVGQFIGNPFNNSTLLQIKTTLEGFYSPLVQNQTILQYTIQADAPTVPGTNNPQSQLDNGIVHVGIKVKLAPIIINIFASMLANQGVNISITVTPNLGA